MIDFGLLASMIVAVGVPSLLAWWWPLRTYTQPTGFLDVALIPALVGVLVGRIVTVALDDPTAFGRAASGEIGELLIIRSGVEFWPGLVVAAALLAWAARGDGVPVLARLAAIAPLAMVGYAAYEAGCVVRDGCFGPASPIGLRPPGVATTMVPVGWLMALAVVAAAWGVRRLALRGFSPAAQLAAAAVAIAGIRAVGSIWLPHVGDGLTRQHQTSIVAAVVALITVGVIVAREGQTLVSPAASPPDP
ncbi:MAG: prolipoprotein diacylglyceryl transferase family protein [Actinomycetota bacterium]